MSFKSNLNHIIDDLNNHKNDCAKLYEQYIEERLKSSLLTYYDSLDKSIQYLNDKDELKLLKKINKEK